MPEEKSNDYLQKLPVTSSSTEADSVIIKSEALLGDTVSIKDKIDPRYIEKKEETPILEDEFDSLLRPFRKRRVATLE